MHLTQELELFPDYRVTQMLFKEVKNAAELRQNAVEGKINGALIKPTMVRLIFVGFSKIESKFNVLYVYTFNVAYLLAKSGATH